MQVPKWLIKLVGNIYLTSKPMWIQYKPHHHKVKGRESRQVLNVIHDGDILLRRYDGYLNTFFTPGFWSHAGLYIGNNDIIHAIGIGVVQEDVLEFCRCDSVVVLRVKDISEDVISNAILTAKELEIARTDYDYKFKEKNGSVYCTELVDICYNNVFDKSYEKIAGNNILTPDGVFDSDKVEKIIEIKH